MVSKARNSAYVDMLDVGKAGENFGVEGIFRAADVLSRALR